VRKVWTSSDLDWLPEVEDRTVSLAYVQAHRTVLDKSTTVHRRYFLSSIPDLAAKEAAHIPWSTLLWRTFDVIGAACPTCGRVMALRAVVRGTETGRLLAGLERAARGPPLRAEQRAGTGSAAGVRDGDGGVLLPRRGAPRMRRSGGWHSVDGALGRMTPTRATERLRRQPVARTLNACHHPWLWRQSSTEASQLVAAPIKEGSSPCA